MSEHQWIKRTDVLNLFVCKVCGIVRRADGKNKPCKGPVKITTRASSL